MIFGMLRLLFCLVFLFSSLDAAVARRPIKLITEQKKHYKKISRKTNVAENKPLIIIDAGHGGKDLGAQVQSVMEKRLSLTTSLFLKKELEKLGYRVIMTRSRDLALPLSRRVAIANNMEGTLFVSVHYNSAPNPAAKGIEVFYSQSKDPIRTNESKRLASCVLFGICDETGMDSRGVKTGNLYVTRETQMPAILVEGGFMTSSLDLALLRNRDFLSKQALGIAKGVDKYIKQVARYSLH